VVKELPKLVEWKIPLSVETQTSPATLGFTTIFAGEVEDPSEDLTLKVLPPSTER